MLRTNTTILSHLTEWADSGQFGEIRQKHFEPQSMLLEQGTKPNKVFVIMEGIAKCFFQEENGKTFIVEFLGSGQIVGELEAIKRISCLCNIQAITKLSAYVLPHPVFKLMLERSLPFNQTLLGEMSERIINTSSRSSVQQLYSIEHALKRLLVLQKENGLELSKNDIAAYLGITLRSLNRLLQ